MNKNILHFLPAFLIATAVYGAAHANDGKKIPLNQVQSTCFEHTITTRQVCIMYYDGRIIAVRHEGYEAIWVN